ncbi:diguanylate cyclase [Desulfallas sp. Bu1-1]|uniref:diguanylate cyclase n=1 Tax=Desulfallas sp. Bu1-1 TaxID=2787620 RepID=UPI00189E1A53|nr:diguanylate cyclase [Desulfallas sp. Bu1-1]MBF7083277.1 diguanylate cyclase [Desulfallas sp. Bu1-1]
MNLHADKKMLLAFTSILLGTLVMAGCVVLWLVQISNNTNIISRQQDKITNITQIYENILLQFQSLNKYIATGDPGSLDRFRQLARTNSRLEEQLIEVIRDSRKPLAGNIKSLHDRYNRLCEEKVVPLVRRGAELPLELRQELVRLEESMARSAKEIQDMRVADTRAIIAAAIAKSRFAAGMGILFTGVGIITGITASLLTWRRFFREHTNRRAILNTTRNAVITIESNGKITSFNRVAEELFEIDRSLVLGKNYKDVFTGESTGSTVRFIPPVQDVMSSGKGKCNQEMFYTAPDGWEMVLNIDCLPLTDKKPTGVLLIARDISQRKVIEEKLYEMTLRDGLTGLYNHCYLQKRLSSELKKCGEQNKPLAFILLDIDNFKYYNDNFGHPAGDELLKEFARVLLDNTRSSDIVGRYGGDEFGIILPDTGYKMAVQVAERLRRQITEHAFPNRDLLPGGRLTVSIGIALFPDHANSAHELVRLADEAMYHAKRNSKNQVQLYFSAIEEFQRQLRNSDEDLLQVLNTLLTVINNKDRYTYAHSEKVSEYAELIAQQLHLPVEEIKNIKIAAFLHDLGKLEIPGEILLKNGKLDQREWNIIKQHPRWGSNMLVSFPRFQKIIPWILHHHERYDGSGYPDGLAGEDIPLGARIIAIADSFDAMISQRPYKKSLTINEALNELRANKGKQFDPGLTEIFIQIIEGKYLGKAGEKTG